MIHMLKYLAPGEARTHGLQIMRLTRCLLRYGGFQYLIFKNPNNSSQNAKTIGFGPGLLRPQSRVLTPRRSRFVFIYQLFSWVSLFQQLSQPELMSVSIDGLARLSEI